MTKAAQNLMPMALLKSRRPWTRTFLLVLLATPLFLGIPALPTTAQEYAPSAPHACSGKGSAIVYVIDTSTSMSWIFDEVKMTLTDVVKQSAPEDSIAIILFGERVTTLANYASLDETKKQALYALIQSTSSDSLYTCFPPAVKRGIDYLYDYYRNDRAGKYALVLITDGKDHPPPSFVQSYSLEQALTQHADFSPGKSWTLCYVALKGQIDSGLLTLVNKYNGKFYNTGELSNLLGVAEQKVIESVITHPEYWEELDAAISDHFGRVEVKKKDDAHWVQVMENVRYKLLAGDQVAVREGSKAVISLGSVARIGVKEDTTLELNKVESQPLNKKANIQIEMENGTLWSMVNKKDGQSLTFEVLTPIALTGVRGTDFCIFFDAKLQEQTVSVIDGSVELNPSTNRPWFKKVTLEKGAQSVITADKPPTPPSPIPADVRQEWEKWKTVLSLKASLLHVHFNPIKVTPLIERVVLGPIKSNQKYTAQIPLQYSEKYRGEHAVTVQTLIELPPGASITAEVMNSEDSELRKNVEILLTCQPFLRFIGKQQYMGHLNLRCNDREIKFARNNIELYVLQNPPGFAQKISELPPLTKAVMAAFFGLLASTLIVLVWRNRTTFRRWKTLLFSRIRDMLIRTRLVRLYRGRPVGHLILQTEVEGAQQKRFDLAKISRQSNTVFLGVGKDKANALCLTHSSIHPFHCLLWASRKRNPTEVFIEPRQDAHVAVNGKKITERRQLSNRDEIQIGTLQFTFVDIQSQRQVKVYMNTGERHVGFLEYWDLSAMLFYMTKILELKEEFLTIYFSSVSFIKFYRDESDPERNLLPHPLQKARTKKRKKITVFLNDKSKIHGYVDKKYRYRKGAEVFILPREDDKIQYIYVPGTSITSVVIVDV